MTGLYSNVANLIKDIENSDTFFIIDSIDVARKLQCQYGRRHDEFESRDVFLSMTKEQKKLGIFIVLLGVLADDFFDGVPFE